MRIDFPKTAYLLTIIIAVLYNSITFAGWSTPVRISEPGWGNYPKMIAQGDTLHVVYTNNTGRDNVRYLRSSDAGQTWGQERRLIDTVNTSNPLFPQIIRNGSKLMAFWLAYYPHQIFRYNLGYSISNDNGITWSFLGYALTTNTEWGFQFSTSGSDSLVNIMAPYLVIDTSVYFARIRSTNFGQSWSSPRPIFSIIQADGPVMAQLNRMVDFSWAGRFVMDSSWEVYYMRSTDGGLNWSDNINISEHDQHQSYWPSICASDSGNVIISWFDFKYSPNPWTGDIFIRQSSDSGQTWRPEQQLTFNHWAERSAIASVGDTIYLAWEDKSLGEIQGSIYFMESTDGGMNWSDPYWLDGTEDNSWNPAIAASNGKVYVIWYDERHYPDTAGIYFSRWDPEPNDIENGHNIIPEEMSLSAYPNPFNSSTIISFSNLKDDEIKIFDIKGSLVRILRPEQKENGAVIWDATDDGGQKVSSGIYFARASSGGNSKTIKLIYLK
jgi:hypothetical protein